jgi:hypothetical protein
MQCIIVRKTNEQHADENSHHYRPEPVRPVVPCPNREYMGAEEAQNPLQNGHTPLDNGSKNQCLN